MLRAMFLEMQHTHNNDSGEKKKNS